MLDSWNERVLVINPDRAVSAVALHGVGEASGAPPFGSFTFSSTGQGAFMDRTTVYTIGGGSSFVASDAAGVDGVVGELEIHGDEIVARRISGEFEVVGTLDGSEPAGALKGLPDVLVVNELFDRGVFLFLPDSPTGHVSFGDTELIPVTGHRTPTGDAVLVVGGPSDGSLLLVHVTAAGAVRTARMVDESGDVFAPGSVFDEGALFSIAPDGSSLAVLSCAATACTLRTFDLR